MKTTGNVAGDATTVKTAVGLFLGSTLLVNLRQSITAQPSDLVGG